ncbi:NAD(P)-binding protein [Didymella exigua CBS 183.55]|uniref:NAD(P)-binding protein n=1 Tax=Didymella exigua CBS 183.55 TaxID=1150837 RepID=A0A6A5RJP0_9PLEO|nr:NAD(P)-binding protein [Didymella exigua CBS 183.55]KAF1927480.1 NAD(P)-binding protein [Didymella exigua CBS 183.55]
MGIPKPLNAAVKQGTGDTATVVIQDVPIRLPTPDQIFGHEGADMQDRWQIGNGTGIKIRDGVEDEEARPIMCGGLTAYVSCKISGVSSMVKSMLTGSALGHFDIQYAKAMGMRVIAIDGVDAKRELCMRLDAEALIDFTTTTDIPAEVTNITAYGAHDVIVLSAAKAEYEQGPHLLRPGGTMVCVGLSTDTMVIAGAHTIMMSMRKLNIVGNFVETLRKCNEALDITARGLVRPILTHGGLEDINRFCGGDECG